jgi:hypothetical protein
MKIISAYVWAWRNYESGETAIKSLKRFYSDADIFINVDYEGDIESYKKIAEKYNAELTINNFQVGYCGDFGDVLVGKECWTREETFEWIRGLYEACKKCKSKYMLILEEDNFIINPVSLLNTEFSMAIHASIPSAAGNLRPNSLPNEFMIYSDQMGGIASSPGYGAGGGCIFKPDEFIKSWEKCKDKLWNDYDSLKQVSKIIGWQDFIIQFVMMIGGYEISQNFHAAQPWEDPNWLVGKNYMGEDYEMVCGLKDHTVITF